MTRRRAKATWGGVRLAPKHSRQLESNVVRNKPNMLQKQPKAVGPSVGRTELRIHPSRFARRRRIGGNDKAQSPERAERHCLRERYSPNHQQLALLHNKKARRDVYRPSPFPPPLLPLNSP